MKYNYPELKGICAKTLQKNLCNGCQQLENLNFRGKEKCNMIKEPVQSLKNITGIQEKMKI
ncbi:MAG: hypothetical protein IJV31_10470 [Clostridia bacterium]|nr:hypothetical protein [Clostridia bacterium]